MPFAFLFSCIVAHGIPEGCWAVAHGEDAPGYDNLGIDLVSPSAKSRQSGTRQHDQGPAARPARPGEGHRFFVRCGAFVYPIVKKVVKPALLTGYGPVLECQTWSGTPAEKTASAVVLIFWAKSTNKFRTSHVAGGYRIPNPSQTLLARGHDDNLRHSPLVGSREWALGWALVGRCGPMHLRASRLACNNSGKPRVLQPFTKSRLVKRTPTRYLGQDAASKPRARSLKRVCAKMV